MGKAAWRSGGKGRVRLSGKQVELLEQSRAGTLDVSDWDLEELLRGHRRARDGTFRGRPPMIVPRDVHDELARRVKTQVAHDLRYLASEHIEPIYKSIMDAANGGIAPEDVPGLRLQLEAAKDLMDRFVVAKSEKVEVSGTMKHDAVIGSVTVDRTLPEDDEDIVDAEVVDEDDDEFEFEDDD